MFPEKFSAMLTHCYCSCVVSSVWGSAGRRCSYSGEDPGTRTEAVGGGGAADGDVGGVEGVDDTPHPLQDGVGDRQPYPASLQGT